MVSTCSLPSVCSSDIQVDITALQWLQDFVTPHGAGVGGQENGKPYYDSSRPHGFVEGRLTGIGYGHVIAENQLPL